MEITLLEKDLEAGPWCWLYFLTHLDSGDVEIRLWDSPYESYHGRDPIELAKQTIISELARGHVEVKCGQVVTDILAAIENALDNPPDEWVVGAFYKERKGERISYKASRKEFSDEYCSHFLHCIKYYTDRGMSKEEVLDMMGV